MEKLTCAECGYENEPERVYCHNCGAKLDRSLLPEKKDPAAEGKPRKAPSGKLKVRQPFLKPLIQAVLLAALTAAVVLAVLPPEDAPKFDSGELVSMPDINIKLAALEDIDVLAKASFSEAEVNTYLKSTMRAKSKGALSDYIEYVGTAVDLEKGSARVYLVQSIFGFPFYTHETVAPAGQPGALAVKYVSCGLGRLDMPAFAAPAIDLIMNKVWTAKKRDIESLSKLGGITLEKDRVMFISKGK